MTRVQGLLAGLRAMQGFHDVLFQNKLRQGDNSEPEDGIHGLEKVHRQQYAGQERGEWANEEGVKGADEKVVDGPMCTAACRRSWI